MTDSGYEYFTLAELECHGGDCCGHQEVMQPEFMNHLVELRRLIDMPMVISSAYRCPLYNSVISTTGDTGPHTEGVAVDVATSYSSAVKLLKSVYAMNHRYETNGKDAPFRGIGIRQSGDPSKRMIHLDGVKGNERIWTY
jgi:Peptidase M15